MYINKNMYIPILIIIIILVICYREKKLYQQENFSTDDNLTYLGLNHKNYLEYPNDHYFYNNTPISDNGIIGINHGGKYCDNNKLKPKRRHITIERVKCDNSNNIINKLFWVNVKGLTNYFKKRTVTKQSKFEEKSEKEIKTELNKIIKRYSELQDEINFSNKFIDENEINTNSYQRNNNKLGEKLKTTNSETNKNVSMTLMNKSSYDTTQQKIFKIRKITKYTLYVLAILTIIYLLRKKVNSPNYQNNIN